MSSPFGFLLSAEAALAAHGRDHRGGRGGAVHADRVPAEAVAPVVSLGVVYLPAVLVVSIIWGAWLGFATAVLSAAAFNFFHLPPVGHFTIRDSSNWVALVAFLVVAALVELGGGGDARAGPRRGGAPARGGPGGGDGAGCCCAGNSLPRRCRRRPRGWRATLSLTSAAIEMESVEGDERSVAFPLREGTRRLGTLLVGARHLRGRACAGCRSAWCRRWRRC